ncbi:MAG: bifunctional phosphoribosyl-AMP cyclohydrolase/phosphoribosyl-ATP diphosphatase HisIE [Saprospiraceae bacterium]
MKNLNYDKLNGLIPAIIQDAKTNKVLMLGFMNEEALAKTQEEGKVTFFSRTKNRLWTKGETSGNFLNVVNIQEDCDDDTLLIKVNPVGEVCHTGSDTCFKEVNRDDAFLYELERVILDRKNKSHLKSYTASLFKKGINKIAQKVGEEAVELVIESKDDNRDLFLNEAADLMYHFEVLLAAKDVKLQEVVEILRNRHE